MSKMLDKVSKLLAKAENAGTPEEAEAFMAKAQELASINNVDLALARMHQAKKEKVQEVEKRRIQVSPHTRRSHRKHFAELAMAICDVNDVKYLIGGGEYALFCVGFPEDLDVVEALYTHLSVQMASECDAALARGEHRDIQEVRKTNRVEIPWEERDWGGWSGRQYYDENPDEDAYYGEEVEDARRRYLRSVDDGELIWSGWARGGRGGYRKPVPPPAYRDEPVLDDDGNEVWETKEVSSVDGRVFRSHFYGAFVQRIRGRLWEIRRATERSLGIERNDSSEVALALRDKSAEVQAAHDEQRATVTRTYTSSDDVQRKGDRTGRGREAGLRAAETIPVEGREVERSL